VKNVLFKKYLQINIEKSQKHDSISVNSKRLCNNYQKGGENESRKEKYYRPPLSTKVN